MFFVGSGWLRIKDVGCEAVLRSSRSLCGNVIREKGARKKKDLTIFCLTQSYGKFTVSNKVFRYLGTFRFHAAPGSQSGTNRTKADIFVKYDNNKAMMELTHWKDINEESICPNHLRKLCHRLAYKLH